jgi:hypothetical protein
VILLAVFFFYCDVELLQEPTRAEGTLSRVNNIQHTIPNQKMDSGYFSYHKAQ